jgi:hypothetical protein
MKHLILAVLVAFSLPVMAASINLNSSRSNVVEDADSSRAIVKSKSNITNNAVEYKDGEDGVNRKGKPTKEQCAATADEKVVAQCKQLGMTVRAFKSNSSDRAIKCSPMPQCADGPFPPERPPAERLKKLDSRAQ